jgi:Asp-tRNA(Asn)/Glu-tRNA(Gln) amidotransferase C subunit
MDFLWHKVSETERENIKKEAKAIMDNFSKKLERINKKTEEPIIERDECERQEAQGKESDEMFRKAILNNAPEKNNDFVIGEKGGW